MRKLVLPPDGPVDLKRGDATRGAILTSPTAIFASTEAIQAQTVNLSWSQLSPEQYDYLMAFWRLATREGALPCLIDLPVRGGTFAECKAVLSAPSISAVSGGTASIAMEASVVPLVQRYGLSAATTALLADVTEEV